MEALAGGLERVPLKIFKRSDGFSFSREQPEASKVIELTPRKFRIIVEKFEASGEQLENARNALDSALHRHLTGHPALELSQMTVEQLDKKRAELQEHLSPGAAKSQLAEDLGVDYIITGSLTFK